MVEIHQKLGIKINTLEESLKIFNKPCLLEQLDVDLELVRRNKITDKQLLDILKSVDKDFLKLSILHHPDKFIGRKKVEEIENAQNMQIAINATRLVLKALTEEFLKDIDIHYKYEFFAKVNINTLINEKQIESEINNLMCKISLLSEIKRVNIIGEIRNFLLKCHNCLESFRHNKQDFARYRDNAFHHLKKCIEGYEMLFLECKLIVEECTTQEDENTKRVIQSMYEKSREESKTLRKLQEVAEKSLSGTFEIFPIYEPKYSYSVQTVTYEPVVPKELEYFVLPFVFYVDVLLMCSVMVKKKSLIEDVKDKILAYLRGKNEKESIFFKEPVMLKAYHLASYFSKKHYEEEVKVILKEKGSLLLESGIIQNAFKETVKEIEQFLAQEFDINSYKEGKSNLEQFNERLFQLNDSMVAFEELEKKLQEKFKLYEQETDEISKKYNEMCSEIEKIEKQNIKRMNLFHVCPSTEETANETTEMIFEKHQY